MDLDAYFERIGYQGSPRVDEATLFALHEAHLASIPYENLDLQLGHPKRLDERRFEERLVAERRGGWCYEMNGLFRLVLETLGFRVERRGATVVRNILGDEWGRGHHLVLTVDLGRRFVADVGLGDGPLHPFPLEEREWSDAGFRYAFGRTDDGWWRFENDPHGLAPSFDFQDVPRALDWFEAPCHWLQTDEGSPFRGLAMLFRRDRTRVRALRDTSWIVIEDGQKTEERLRDRDVYAGHLRAMMDRLGDAEITTLWEDARRRVAARAALLAEEVAGS